MKFWIIFGVLFGLFIIGMILLSVKSNEDWDRNTWYQNAIIVEKTDDVFWGDYCVLEADDGKRYNDSCDLYLVGEKVRIQMQLDRIIKIVEISP